MLFKSEKSSVGGVGRAGSVVKKRERSVGGVEAARGITQKSPGTDGGIVVASVCKERAGAHGGVELPSGDDAQRRETYSCVVYSGRKAQEGVLTLCGVATGIPSIRRWTDRLR